MHRQIAGRLTGPVTKWIVLVIGLIAIATCSPFFQKLADVQDNDSTSWLPGSAESTRAFDQLDAFGDPETLTTGVVYEKAAGFDAQDVAALAAQAGEIAGIKGAVGEVMAPRLSDDGQVALIEVRVSFGGETFIEMPKAAEAIREIAKGGPQDEVYVAGFGGLVANQAEVFSGSDVNLLLITIGIVILILLITYRSPTMWVLPIFSAMVALSVSNAVIYALAKYAGLTVNGQSAFILTVLVVGAGTDYALLLVARYREELRKHDDRHEAMAVALHRATPAILASAATVALGMLCLTLAEMNSTAGLGPVLAVGVVVTVLVMVTLLPALLVICGRAMFWPLIPASGSTEPTATGLWARVGNRIALRPRRVWLVTAGLLLLACLGLFTLDNRGLSAAESFTDSQGVESLQGDVVAADHGLTDASNPLLIVADADQAQAVMATVANIDGVVAVSPTGEADERVLIAAAITGDPYSQEAFDIVRVVRSAVDSVPGPEVLVGGSSAVGLDIAEASARDNLVVTPVVLGVVLLVLMLLLRSVAAPLILIGTVVLSYGAALGLSSLIFTQVLGQDATDAAFPLFAFVFLVALGIDYNIFLMTRVREETAVHGTRKGSLLALSATGGVITSAGLVLAATFAALGTLPLVFALQLGIAVALGVLLDTIIVRSVLVTALNLDLGAKIWWPSKLDEADLPLDATISGPVGTKEVTV